MKITALQYGKTNLRKQMAFKDAAEGETIPIALIFFLIETENKKILVDAGCDTMPRYELSDFYSPVTILENYGVKREEITHVLMTHGHHDHADGLRYYKDALICMHSDSFEDIQKYITDEFTVKTFDDDELKITDNITLKHIGGHTSGSCVVLVKSPQTTYVICGDECYSKVNIEKQIPTGNTRSVETSTNFVKEYSKPCYTPLISHDPDMIGKAGFKVIYES